MDLPDVMTSEEMNQILNRYNVPFFETVATTGIGVLDALKSITKLVFNDLSKKALLQKRARTSTSLYTAGGTAVEQPLAAAKPTTPPPQPASLVTPLPFVPAKTPTPPPPPPEPEVEAIEPYEEVKIEEPLPLAQQEPELEDDPLSSLEPELPGSVDNPVDELDDALDAIQEVEPMEEFDEVSDDTNLLKSSPFHKPATDEPTFDLVADDAEHFEASEPDDSYSDISNEGLQIENQPESYDSQREPIEFKPEPIEFKAEPVEIKPETVEIKPETVELKPEAINPFSYGTLFEGSGEFSTLMHSMEAQIAEKKYDDAMDTARNVYSHLLTQLYPKQDILNGNEALKIFALDIKFRRFLRFKRLLDSTPDPQNLLFIHHFLCDLYLSLKEL
jgi:hypothetical protein